MDIIGTGDQVGRPRKKKALRKIVREPATTGEVLERRAFAIHVGQGSIPGPDFYGNG